MVIADHQLRQIRRELLAYLGHDAVAAIHRQSRVWDSLAIVASMVVFAAFVWLIAVLPFGPLWCLCIVAQGIVSILIGLVNHDLFVHRQIFGDKGSWLASLLFTLPLPLTPTGYAQTHLRHHRYIGTEHDTEVYKQDVNTRWRRLLFCTLVGLKRATDGVWATPKRPNYFALRTTNAKLHQRLAVEKRLKTGLDHGVGHFMLFEVDSEAQAPAPPIRVSRQTSSAASVRKSALLPSSHLAG